MPRTCGIQEDHDRQQHYSRKRRDPRMPGLFAYKRQNREREKIDQCKLRKKGRGGYAVKRGEEDFSAGNAPA
jgi:hypothetical protein